MHRPLCALPLVVCAAALPAHADWTFTVLHPYPAGDSAGQAAFGPGLTAGYAGATGFSDHHAALWTGDSPADFLDLHPAGFAASRINRSSGTQHVGHAVMANGNFRAGVWLGDSADTFVNLHPGGGPISYALGTDGQRQVGFVESRQGVRTAYMWSGSADSAVSLHPAGAGHSQAFDIGGGRQVGYVEHVFSASGGYWEGDAESWTPLLAPSDGFAGTFTNCISPDGRQQGGFAVSRISGVNWAAIWEGSTDTFRSLHPDPSLIGSTILDTDGTYQVGYTIHFGQFAAIWSGTAESYQSLHAALPDYYNSSHAYGVFADEQGLWVAGSASNTDAGRWEAVVWHLPVPAPASPIALCAGLLAATHRRRR
ncbi:MAG TPA: hypothetical protein VFF69_13930 [Phycisphaerales bacterium]|nr:hypothetical protein [Phycisphaerales bacterium]